MRISSLKLNIDTKYFEKMKSINFHLDGGEKYFYPICLTGFISIGEKRIINLSEIEKVDQASEYEIFNKERPRGGRNQKYNFRLNGLISEKVIDYIEKTRETHSKKSVEFNFRFYLKYIENNEF